MFNAGALLKLALKIRSKFITMGNSFCNIIEQDYRKEGPLSWSIFDISDTIENLGVMQKEKILFFLSILHQFKNSSPFWSSKLFEGAPTHFKNRGTSMFFEKYQTYTIQSLSWGKNCKSTTNCYEEGLL